MTPKVWSLWDIINIFNSFELARLLMELARLQRHCLEIKGAKGSGAKAPRTLVNNSVARLAGVAKLCREVGFNAGMNKADLSAANIDDTTNLDVSALHCELRNVHDVFLTELFNHRFLYVKASRARYLQLDPGKDEPIFGTRVWDAFPSARFDIQEAGHCLAAECNTAAVFHLMRAVEWGLRALSVSVRMRKLRSVNPKSKKISYTPLGWAEWKQILDQLNSKITKKIGSTKKGKKKQLYQEFYLPAMLDIEAIKDAWRIHVMHTRREYESGEGEAILDRVKRLMELLATKVKEV